jgi:hypothetical protein
MPEVYCPAITDPLKLMHSIPHKNTLFLVPLYLSPDLLLLLGINSAQASADFLTISGGFVLEVILTHQIISTKSTK